jgi:hypothetical protein
VVILIVLLLENENIDLTSEIERRAKSVNTSSLGARIGLLFRAAELGSAARRGSLLQKTIDVTHKSFGWCASGKPHCPLTGD